MKAITLHLGFHAQRNQVRAPYDLVIALDRSDTTADRCLIETESGKRRTVVLDIASEALCEWLAQLCSQRLIARVEKCVRPC